jgi:hypothetical protein
MECIQCGRSSVHGSVLKIIQEKEYVPPEKFLCRGCCTCSKCRSVSIDRPSCNLKEYKDGIQIVSTMKNERFSLREVSINVCMSLPWECLKCSPCAICGCYDVFARGNCHAVCFNIWCIWKLGNSDISHFPKDILICILRALWAVNVSLLKSKM